MNVDGILVRELEIPIITDSLYRYQDNSPVATEKPPASHYKFTLACLQIRVPRYMKNHFRVSCTEEKIGKHWDILSNVVRLSMVACKDEEGSSSNLVCFKELKNTTLGNIYFSNQMQQRFLLQILLLAQHVSGITMPIIRSSRVLYSGCCLWYFVL